MKPPLIDAVIFDLDGVITESTALHSLAWKKMFDQFLKNHAREADKPFHEFSHEDDYLAFVDGKPRYKGVQSFLESRGIQLPYGDPEQEPGQDTICSLGNLKNHYYNQLLEEKGVDIYATTVELIHQLREAGIPLAVASSSKNARRVLELTGLIDLFQARVDGVVSAELGLAGKPSPDIFQAACDRLGARHERSVVIEDANSGVQAGYRGNFGLVIGVAREDNQLELKLNGADIVVEDLLEINIERMRNWFTTGIQENQWSITYDHFDPDEEGTQEALCTIGNGYFGTRGAMEEIPAQADLHYPGTYIAGVYNRLESKIVGRTVSNEDFVNCPNWLPISFKINTGEWFDPSRVEILEFKRRLNFKTGVLSRMMIIRDQEGYQTRIDSQRLASMADPHLAALSYTITPLNYARTFTIRAELDGDLINQGVKRYRQLSSRHLQPLKESGRGNLSSLLVETNRSRIKIAEAARLEVFSGQEPASPDYLISTQPGKVTTTFEIEARSDRPVTVNKLVSIFTSPSPAGKDPYALALKKVQTLSGYESLKQASQDAWETIWDQIDIKIKGDRLVQKILRLHLYHSIITASPHHKELDAGIPARGLHGEAYRGHIFWDEIFVIPFYNLFFPETSRSALMYRVRRLPAARANAREAGYRGALFPWQSGSQGGEETQKLHLNPISGKWGPDYSHLQRHISLAVAYNVWSYFWTTQDHQFLQDHGAELFLEICRFWVDLAEKDPQTGRCSISGVMGPDEFHEHYPGVQEGGLRNNAYTNLMVIWSLNRAFEILDLLPSPSREEISGKIDLTAEELQEWKQVAHQLHIPLSEEGILEQFEGYFQLEELDWEHYRKNYGDIQRMDRILKAEGKSPNDYKVAKQADALMIFYLLSEQEISGLLKQVGCRPPEDLLAKNFHYYLQRTSHGSSLSRLVHAYLAHLVGEDELSWQLYLGALRSDFMDIQGGTTREGIHLGVMTGTALFTLRTHAGLDWNQHHLKFKPELPSGWQALSFNVTFQGTRYEVHLTTDQIRIRQHAAEPRLVEIDGEQLQLAGGEWQTAAVRPDAG
ncbi:MAG: beta-phosphoglucomutase family hydrolase [Anaerolineales bacterium]|nr:beta-phosphoglucomutase family hydrolase [Anaerolineales bacterium]